MSASTPDIAEWFDYGTNARLVGHTRQIGANSYTTRYAYDDRGRITGINLPDGQRLRHHYHETGPNRGSLRAITRARWFGLADDTTIAEIDLDGRDGNAGYLIARRANKVEYGQRQRRDS